MIIGVYKCNTKIVYRFLTLKLYITCNIVKNDLRHLASLLHTNLNFYVRRPPLLYSIKWMSLKLNRYSRDYLKRPSLSSGYFITLE